MITNNNIKVNFGVLHTQQGPSQLGPLFYALYFVKKIILLTLLSSLAYGDCALKVEDIKPAVKEVLLPLHDQINIFIPKEDFVIAHSKVIALKERIDQCNAYHKNYEYQNYHFSRWGEKSIKFQDYSFALSGLIMQLNEAHVSFELGILRPLFVKTSMWKKAANEFYAKKYNKAKH